MGLTDLWKLSRNQLEDKPVQQIIAFAGSGVLTDAGPSCAEFREFLGHVPSTFLEKYADQCLSEAFSGSGFALQDVINQIGRRLGFTVTDGRYRGTPAQVGYDGLWRFPDNHTVIVEVKTSDAYRVDLDRIAGYRKALTEKGEVQENASSILLIVGRKDTGDLEAQIRGSRHAWDVRIISIDGLIRLMRLKETMDDPKTVQQICAILIPHEFTRLDSIIDLVFSTAEEVKQESLPSQEIEDIQSEVDSAVEGPAALRAACMARVEKHLGATLIKRSASGYSSPDGQVAVVCSVSKQYIKPGFLRYWFAFHTHQSDFLNAAVSAYVAFGCGSEEQLLLIPFADFKQWLDGLNITERGGGVYWHVHVLNQGGAMILDSKKGLAKIDLSKYVLS
jgi:hypothetical protein